MFEAWFLCVFWCFPPVFLVLLLSLLFPPHLPCIGLVSPPMFPPAYQLFLQVRAPSHECRWMTACHAGCWFEAHLHLRYRWKLRLRCSKFTKAELNVWPGSDSHHTSFSAHLSACSSFPHQFSLCRSVFRYLINIPAIDRVTQTHPVTQRSYPAWQVGLSPHFNKSSTLKEEFWSDEHVTLPSELLHIWFMM